MLASRAWWLLTLAPLACGRAPAAAPRVSAVELSEQAPPAGYVEVRALSVQSGKGCGVLAQRGSREEADQLLRAAAEKVGATYVRITGRREPGPNHQCLEHEYQVRGVAYRLPPAPLPAAPPLPRTLLDFESDALGKPARSTARTSVALSLAAGENGGSALSVSYRCSDGEETSLLSVGFDLGGVDLRGAHALSARVKADRATTLKLSLQDQGHVTWTQESSPLSVDVWQTVTFALDKFSRDASAGSPDVPTPTADLRTLGVLTTAPTECADGHFLLDDLRLE